MVPAAAGLLRRAVGAQRPRGGGAAATPGGSSTPSRRAGVDARRRQRRRLRLDDEGVRRAARRRPGVRRAGRGPSPTQVRDVSEILAELGPVAPRHPLRDDRRLPRRLPPRARPGRPRPAARAARARSPASSCGRSPSPSCAAARPASTTSSTRSRRASSATARRPTSSPPAPQVLVTANPGCLMQVDLRHRAVRPPDGDGAHRRGARRLHPRARRGHPDPRLSAGPLSHPLHLTTRESDVRPVPAEPRPGRRVARRSAPSARAVPLVTLFVLLGGLRLRAWVAGLISLAVALVVAVVALRDAGRPGAARRRPRARPSGSSRSCGS